MLGVDSWQQQPWQADAAACSTLPHTPLCRQLRRDQGAAAKVDRACAGTCCASGAAVRYWVAIARVVAAHARMSALPRWACTRVEAAAGGVPSLAASKSAPRLSVLRSSVQSKHASVASLGSGRLHACSGTMLSVPHIPALKPGNSMACSGCILACCQHGR